MKCPLGLPFIPQEMKINQKYLNGIFQDFIIHPVNVSDLEINIPNDDTLLDQYLENPIRGIENLHYQILCMTNYGSD